jgi:hypothetical protein
MGRIATVKGCGLDLGGPPSMRGTHGASVEQPKPFLRRVPLPLTLESADQVCFEPQPAFGMRPA